MGLFQNVGKELRSLHIWKSRVEKKEINWHGGGGRVDLKHVRTNVSVMGMIDDQK